MTKIKIINTNAGKITISAVVVVCVSLFLMASLNFSKGTLQKVLADDLSTSVTVLNTPPQWDTDAQEATESSTTTPTNSGDTVSWVATADDSNDDDYYLIICKTSGAPTPGTGVGEAPECNGGDANEWAISAYTTDEAQATVATTTAESWAQSNVWYAFICDAVGGSSARCHADYKQGTYPTASPFNVNHVPNFRSFSDNSGKDPGEDITFSVSADDPDNDGTQDTVKLFVCKTAVFSTSTGCAGGTWATSTFQASNPTAVYSVPIPSQDDDYEAYGYIMDSHSFAATSTVQGTDSTMTVNNVAPDFIGEAGNIDLYDSNGDPLNVIEPQGTTTWNVSFNVNDNNSCENAASGDEISSAVVNVYRSGITQAGCADASDYNANHCYSGTSTMATLVCSQDAGSCAGPSVTQASWTCTTTVWYVADPTDGAGLSDSTWWNETWLTSVVTYDDDGAASTFTETTDGGTELTYLVGYDVATTSIAYGALEPDQENDPIDRTTDIIAIGNVGLDEDLYGDGMCTTWSAPDSCPVSTTGTIPVDQQVFATSSVAYALGTSLTASTSPTEVEVNVLKTTSTSSPQTKNLYWGIHIPDTITVAGSYIGQNTITAVKGEAQQW